VVNFRSVDLEDVVDYCIQLSGVRAKDRDIVFKKYLPDNPLRFLADTRACEQILLNLLSNAVKFTGDGGEVSVAAVVRDNRVRITVRDKDIGIPASVLSRLGQAFEQA
jgi:signal transduction histidine kinase